MRPLFLSALLVLGAQAETLFIAEPLTPEGAFTEGIEGPACDRAGNIFAVNFEKQQTIGRTTPEGKSEVFVTLPNKSTGNGIVFDSGGMMFVADYVGHNVLRIDPGSRKIEVFAHDDRMNQPNDLALAPDGTLWASDPNWKGGTGQVWRIDRDGKASLVLTNLGTSNGIEVSPDGRVLYVNESVQRNIWAWTITPEKTLIHKRLVRNFPDHGFDGMRCDVAGNLYVTRHGKGTVVKISPIGQIIREIDVLGKRPSNLCFGGPDGRTVYVTEVDHTRLVKFRVDLPGRSFASATGGQASAPKALRALFLTGGGYHDYDALVPHLTTNLSRMINARFDVNNTVEPLNDPKFADGYDLVVYDFCFDEAPEEALANAMKATAAGKPAVMIHCAVHAFRKTKKVADWEYCCGARSKVHDPYQAFTVRKVDTKSPVVKFFPDTWETKGDELYQITSIHPNSRQLLRVTSPHDGREHAVCWTYRYEKGPVFATTLGHDMKTAATPEYLQLLANGILFVTGKLTPDGKPAAGFEGPAR